MPILTNILSPAGAHLGSKLNPFLTAYMDRVLAAGGEITSSSKTSTFTKLPKYNNILFGWLTGAGIYKRTSGILNFAEKLYSFYSELPAEVGSDLVVNGDFSAWTADAPDNWIKEGTHNATNYVTESSGAARIVSDGTYTGIKQAILTVGKWYKVTFNVKAVDTGFSISVGGSSELITTTGVKILYKQAVSNNTLFIVRNFDTGAVDFTIDNVTVTEVEGDVVIYDASQVTADSQPFFHHDGSFANENTGVRFISHPEIAFTAIQPWTITTVLNWNGTTTDHSALLWNNVNGKSGVYLKFSNVFKLFVYTEAGSTRETAASVTDKIVGKNAILNLVAPGNGTILVYIDKTLISTLTVASDFKFSTLFKGAFSRPSHAYVSGHFVRNVALSEAEITTEANALRNIIPEMTVVRIGDYDFAKYNTAIACSTNGTGITKAADATDWQTGAARWNFHTDINTGIWSGKLYNRAARDVIAANPPIGYHVATQAELEALAALGGNALKAVGTDYWATTGGTNSSGFNALGGSSINANGTFNAIKETASFWCADSDNVLKVYHNSDVAEIVSAAANEGHSIRFVKNIDWL